MRSNALVCDFERELGARDRGAGVVDRGFRLAQAGDVLVERVLERLGVDLGEDLVLLHRIVEVDIDRRDLAGDFRADLDLLARLHGAGGGDDAGDVALARP